MTRSVINAQDELNKLSQKTGISVESLAGIGFAAEQSGVEIEKVGKAARQFGILIAEANAGNKSTIDSLKNLGVEYQRLKRRHTRRAIISACGCATEVFKRRSCYCVDFYARR